MKVGPSNSIFARDGSPKFHRKAKCTFFEGFSSLGALGAARIVLKAASSHQLLVFPFIHGRNFFTYRAAVILIAYRRVLTYICTCSIRYSL